jgi:hypothetical protein
VDRMPHPGRQGRQPVRKAHSTCETRLATSSGVGAGPFASANLHRRVFIFAAAQQLICGTCLIRGSCQLSVIHVRTDGGQCGAGGR